MKFKLNDRVSWSVFNLNGTVTDIKGFRVYIMWDGNKQTISYGTFECRNMEVIAYVFKVGDRVTHTNSNSKGVIIFNDVNKDNLFLVRWDNSCEYFYTTAPYLKLDNTIVATKKSKIPIETCQQDFFEWSIVNEAASLVVAKGYQHFLSKLTKAIAARSEGVL